MPLTDDPPEIEVRTHYRYVISLRLRHPNADPAYFTQQLALTPRSAWQAGSPRRTPTGTKLSGVYKNTYWYAPVLQGRWPQTLNEGLQEVLAQLQPHRLFLRTLRDESGSAELFVGWFFDHQSGEVLSYDVMQMAGDLAIDISLDIYPPDQPQNIRHDIPTLSSDASV